MHFKIRFATLSATLDQLCACFVRCLYGEGSKINVDDHYFIKIEIINIGYLGREILMLKSMGISSIIMLLLPTALKGIENLSSVRLL